MLVLLLVEVTVIIIGDLWNKPLVVIVLLFSLLLVILTVLGTSSGPSVLLWPMNPVVVVVSTAGALVVITV